VRGHAIKRSWNHRFWRAALAVMLLCVFEFSAPAEPVAAHHLQGTVHGYLVLKADGQVAAVGDLLQMVHGDRVTSHLIFHFKDGSLDDEVTVFSQRGNFRLISDHHIQKGPFFQHPTDITIDPRSGEVTTRSTGKDGKEDVKTEHMNLPADLYNGMITPVAENLAPEASAEVSMIAATPKPRLVKLKISPEGEEDFSLTGFERKALHYQIKIDLGGLAGVVAPIIGKQPPDIQVWIEGGKIPAFVGEEGPISEGGPTVTIQQTGPALPVAADTSEPKTATAK
jgi:hypothetical protein